MKRALRTDSRSRIVFQVFCQRSKSTVHGDIGRRLGMAFPAAWFLFLAGVLIMASAPILSRTAHAEVRVEGGIDSMMLEARDTSVREALEALSAFGLLVQNSAGLDRRISGTYQGSLRRVVSALLVGRNYVAIHSGGRVEIRDFGASSGAFCPR